MSAVTVLGGMLNKTSKKLGVFATCVAIALNPEVQDAAKESIAELGKFYIVAQASVDTVKAAVSKIWAIYKSRKKK